MSLNKMYNSIDLIEYMNNWKPFDIISDSYK